MSQIAHLAASAAALQVNTFRSRVTHSVGDMNERFELPERTSSPDQSNASDRSRQEKSDAVAENNQKSDAHRSDHEQATGRDRADHGSYEAQKSPINNKRGAQRGEPARSEGEKAKADASPNTNDTLEIDKALLSKEEIIADLEALLSQNVGTSDGSELSTSFDIDPQLLEISELDQLELDQLKELYGDHLSDQQLQALALQQAMVATPQGQTTTHAAQLTESLQKITGRLTGEPVNNAAKDGQTPDLMGPEKADISNSTLENLAKQKQAMSDMGQSMNQQSNDANGSVKNTDAINVKMDGVEVLETKNFAPVSQPISNNGTNLVDALSKTPLVNAVNTIDQIDALQNTPQTKVLNTIKLQLKPAELGLVTAIMKMQGEVLQVDIKVENVEAFRQLNDDSSAIAKALKGHGFAIEQVNVQLSLNGDKGQNQSGQQGQQNGQSFQQQSDADQMRNSQGNQERTSGGRGQFENEDGLGGLAPDGAQNTNASERDGVYL